MNPNFTETESRQSTLRVTRSLSASSIRAWPLKAAADEVVAADQPDRLGEERLRVGKRRFLREGGARDAQQRRAEEAGGPPGHGPNHLYHRGYDQAAGVDRAAA
jgi:hypothetical protein